jgi:predicted GNAT family acetyltransferase
MIREMLRRLDHERRQAGESGAEGRVVRERAHDASECCIVYSQCTAAEIDEVIRGEVSQARASSYRLEWKVYGHDTPANLTERLLAAGFEAQAAESLMMLPVNQETLAAFRAPAVDIRRVRDREGLEHVAAISRQIGRTNVEEEMARLAHTLAGTPDRMSVHVAYADGVPVACGRIYFRDDSDFAELSGGRTRTTHRNRGLYTALVATRLKEAIQRGRKYMFVDALPTSEPILRRRGFQRLTDTQPFIYAPA